MKIYFYSSEKLDLLFLLRKVSWRKRKWVLFEGSVVRWRIKWNPETRSQRKRKANNIPSSHSVIEEASVNSRKREHKIVPTTYCTVNINNGDYRSASDRYSFELFHEIWIDGYDIRSRTRSLGGCGNRRKTEKNICVLYFLLPCPHESDCVAGVTGLFERVTRGRGGVDMRIGAWNRLMYRRRESTRCAIALYCNCTLTAARCVA